MSIEADLEAALKIAELHRRASYVALGIIAVLIIIVFFTVCRATPNPIPPKEQAAIDSQRITKPAFDSTRRAVTQRVRTTLPKLTHDFTTALVTRKVADTYRHLADSALAVARAAHDTASAAFTAAVNATRGADSLRAANDRLTASLNVAKGLIRDLQVQLGADSLRQKKADDLNTALTKDLQNASPPCRVLLVAKCPSRTVAFVTGAILAGVSTFAIVRRP